MRLLYLLVLITACSSASPDPGDCADGKCDDHLPAACKAADIVTIDRGYGRYRARYRAAAPGQPTIVFMPGGPGNTSIGEDMSAWIPAELGLVQTDPRGVGCNELVSPAADPLAFYSTDQIAGDVVAMIEYLELRDYVLYGHSYGTQLATRVASFVGGAPRAVILEGVLGRAFRADELPAQAYADQWANVLRPTLPADALAILDGDAPLGIDGALWGKYFMAMMPRGALSGGHPLTNNLLNLSEEFATQTGTNVDENRAALAAEVQMFANLDGVTPAGLVLQRHVACREITDKLPEDNVDVVLDHGLLVPTPRLGSLCTGLTVDDPFDTAAEQMVVPSVYFLGELDPATPKLQSDYHFDHNTHSPRTRVTFKAAGHLPVHFNLVNDPEPCALAVVTAAATQGDLAAALATCKRPSTVDTAPGG
jgi:pimeloyl-ACP methyl ester carboxylesterase